MLNAVYGSLRSLSVVGPVDPKLGLQPRGGGRMKATEAKLLDFLKKSPQFVIPIYQRSYSWTTKECRQLWDDIIRAGTKDDVSAHFIGSVVYIEKGIYQVSSQSPLLVIDGQQRLTTVTLLITALARALDQLDEDKREPIDGFSPRKLRNYYLLNPEEEDDRRHKLLLSQTDKASLIAIVAGRQEPLVVSLRVTENFKQFEQWIDSHKANLAPLCRGLAKLIIVDIALNRDQDNPQLIFESMNSTGKELSQADLIRNYILMGLEPTLQTWLFEEYWRPMEVAFGQEAYVSHFDSFMRHYLTVKTGAIPKVGEVYEAFKAHAGPPAVARVEELVKEIRTFAGHYCAMALGAESDAELKLAFHDLRELTVDVAYPFLLELYQDFVDELLTKEELVAAVRLVESYVFRRAVCSMPTHSMNKTFSTFGKTLRKDRYLESIRANFIRMPSYRRFPANEEFQRELRSRDLYNFRSRTYWLRRMENHGRKERVELTDYTIEHILPQSGDDAAKVPEHWRKELGADWKQVWEVYRHTLGNLTLTGYNSEYCDRAFAEKRDMHGGFKESPLKLNVGIGQLSSWNQVAIESRAERLAAAAVEVWSEPKLTADVLAAYQPTAAVSGYTIADHQHLSAGPVRNLFERFRKEVLALDSCVAEEFLKLYVAYKAETNFVDVIPQSRRLLLSINMPFADIIDSRGMCKDITGVGRWGNGNVQVGLSSPEELPYALGLVRQSFERQMGQIGVA
jgi:uncharacterized protein with ParB-like and HNH nuclease domain/predicted transport protein